MSSYHLRGRIYYCTPNSKIKYISSSSEDEDDLKKSKGHTTSSEAEDLLKEGTVSKSENIPKEELSTAAAVYEVNNTDTKTKFKIRKNLNL